MTIKAAYFRQSAMFEHQIAQEADELKRYPTEEAEEIALISAARGIPLAEARTISERLIANPEKALDTLAREELGLNPDDLGSPIGAALSSFVAFVIGALAPTASRSPPPSRGIALFVVGAVLSLFSGKNALWGGLRMVAIGAAAAAATYWLGSLFNVATAGETLPLPAPGLGALKATFMPSPTVSARLSEEVPCWYYRTFGDQSIHMVDLRQAIDAAKGETRVIQMEGSTQPITNASTNFMAGK
jgi:hypothetical protein